MDVLFYGLTDMLSFDNFLNDWKLDSRGSSGGFSLAIFLYNY
jgi:hypothetical protein